MTTGPGLSLLDCQLGRGYAGLSTGLPFYWIAKLGQPWVLLDCQLGQTMLLLAFQLDQAWICWIANWTRPWFAELPTGPVLCRVANWAYLLLGCETWPGLDFAGLQTRPSYDVAGLPIGPSLDLRDCQVDQTLVCWIANWA